MLLSSPGKHRPPKVWERVYAETIAMLTMMAKFIGVPPPPPPMPEETEVERR